jgi:hypothetical protein
MISEEYPKPRGFTLVESLVVMFTTILLASILIPGLMGRGGREPELPTPEPATERTPVKELTAPPTTDAFRETDGVPPESPAPPAE